MPLDPKKIVEDARRAGLLGSPPDSWPGTPETPAVKLPAEVGLSRIQTAPRKIIKPPARPRVSGKYLFAPIKKGGRILWLHSPA